jgi:hypothetical protein
MLVMSLLNVLSDCSMDCSSPMSAQTEWEEGSSEPLSAGMGAALRHHQQPDRLQRNRLAAGVSRDHHRVPGRGLKSIGTTLCGSSRGCRACMR